VDGNLAALVLLAVTAATALNLFLTLRLAAAVRPAARTPSPLAAPVGTRVPPAAGLDLEGQPAVIVFLSEGCPACRGKAAELAELLPGMARAGVTLRIVALGDISGVIAGTALSDRIAELGEAGLASLNPHLAAPAYIFVDSDGTVLASHYLGDEDWRTFAGQMREGAG
jgi:hypothetical protein